MTHGEVLRPGGQHRGLLVHGHQDGAILRQVNKRKKEVKIWRGIVHGCNVKGAVGDTEKAPAARPL